MGCGGSRTKEDKPIVVFVLGGPGSGKGTQCAKIVEEFGFKHLSTGDLLREEVRSNGPQAEKIEGILKEGKLVPSEILVQLIKDAMTKNGFKGKYLLDGFPRGQENVDTWNKMMKKDVEVAFLLYLTCTEETMEKRLLKRGETSGRSDDNAETIRKRFNTFQKETKPIVELYRKQKKVEEISAEGDVEDIYAKIKESIQKKGINK